MAWRRLPKFIRVLSTKVTVVAVDNLYHDNGDPEDPHQFHRAYGVYTPQMPVIQLDTLNGRERMKGTLLHEALHAMVDAAHIRGLDKEEEEVLVGRLSPILLDFIRSNRAAIAYLQES